MNPDTTIGEMLANATIKVPDYQRAYSWDTSMDDQKSTCQVNTFFRDLQDYVKSKSTTSYYFGHFLYEETAHNVYNIIDGQQRLTTITIFLVALYNRLKELRKLRGRELTDEERHFYEQMIKLGETYRFSTVEYDNQFYRDYVINQVKKDASGLDTESKKRIKDAFDYFTHILSMMDEDKISEMLDKVKEASCTTHIVKDEVEAIQMFIFQNNRGKKPSNLEIIKAQFMYYVHLYGGTEEEKQSLVNEIKNRFESIYKSISSIEHKINEDNVLTYTLRVYFNALWRGNAIGDINKELEKETCIPFIQNFTLELSNSFERLVTFFKQEEHDIVLHSVLNIADFGVLMPFVIKAYGYNVGEGDFRRLCASLESLYVRDKVIGTRADLSSRLGGVYQNFNGNVQLVVNHIEWMKGRSGWWGYWNNEEFERVLEGAINHDIAKKLLWRYENFLIEKGKPGYLKKRYDDIETSHLEHIAPQTENEEVESGYFKYEEDWLDYIECLGNYLLLSGSHNESIGNKPFEVKRETYTQLLQQREIRDMTEEDHFWDKDKIRDRKERIINFLLETY